LDKAEIRDWIGYYKDEITDREFYLKLAKRTEDADFKASLIRLSDVESNHADFWKVNLEKNGVKASKIRPKRIKIKLLLILRYIIGEFLTVRLLEHGEIETCEKYSGYIQRRGTNDQFAVTLTNILNDEIQHEEIFENRIAKAENQLERNRDIILGISDGLVEVLAAIAGLAAFIYYPYLIALGGTVVAIGGTISMSVGAYLSRVSETEYRITEVRKRSLFNIGHNEMKTIKDFKSMGKESASNVALFYILGALIPILPFVFLPRVLALITAIILVGISEAIANAIVALSLSTKMLGIALRSMILALSAAGVTFAVGEAFHIIFHLSVL
jgi:VIT1/CCC1 family predicted Fe2+/Mn2+ transporter